MNLFTQAEVDIFLEGMYMDLFCDQMNIDMQIEKYYPVVPFSYLFGQLTTVARCINYAAVIFGYFLILIGR